MSSLNFFESRTLYVLDDTRGRHVFINVILPLHYVGRHFNSWLEFRCPGGGGGGHSPHDWLPTRAPPPPKKKKKKKRKKVGVIFILHITLGVPDRRNNIRSIIQNGISGYHFLSA